MITSRLESTVRGGRISRQLYYTQLTRKLSRETSLRSAILCPFPRHAHRQLSTSIPYYSTRYIFSANGEPDFSCEHPCHGSSLELQGRKSHWGRCTSDWYYLRQRPPKQLQNGYVGPEQVRFQSCLHCRKTSNLTSTSTLLGFQTGMCLSIMMYPFWPSVSFSHSALRPDSIRHIAPTASYPLSPSTSKTQDQLGSATAAALLLCIYFAAQQQASTTSLLIQHDRQSLSKPTFKSLANIPSFHVSWPT